MEGPKDTQLKGIQYINVVHNHTEFEWMYICSKCVWVYRKLSILQSCLSWAWNSTHVPYTNVIVRNNRCNFTFIITTHLIGKIIFGTVDPWVLSMPSKMFQFRKKNRQPVFCLRCNTSTYRLLLENVVHGKTRNTCCLSIHTKWGAELLLFRWPEFKRNAYLNFVQYQHITVPAWQNTILDKVFAKITLP